MSETYTEEVEVKPIFQTKTFWAAFLSGVGAIAAWATGEMELANMLNTVAVAVIAIFLRKDLPKQKRQ